MNTQEKSLELAKLMEWRVKSNDESIVTIYTNTCPPSSTSRLEPYEDTQVGY